MPLFTAVALYNCATLLCIDSWPLSQRVEGVCCCCLAQRTYSIQP